VVWGRGSGVTTIAMARGCGTGATAMAMAMARCGAGATAVGRGCGGWVVIAACGVDVPTTVATPPGAGFAPAFASDLNASANQQRSDLFARTV
jgi:hypothetical protein